MDSQKPNNFEKEWQMAFTDASFVPPSDMWERIEQDLERNKRRPFLFFLRSSAMLAGVAASLVLALGGILFFNQKELKKGGRELVSPLCFGINRTVNNNRFGWNRGAHSLCYSYSFERRNFN